MADLSEIEVFAAVVKTGSFTAAARLTKLPKSTVSRKVALLEERLGVSLLQRTTRKLRLTDVGSRYYRDCSRILGELAEVEAAAKSAQEGPKGLLRITAPVEFGVSFLEGVLPRFLRTHKEVQVDLVLTDRVVDLVEEGIDVAIRAGTLADSSLVAKKLGTDEFRLYASPSYLKRAEVPVHPKELVNHACLLFTTQSDTGSWTLESGRSRIEIDIQARVSSSSLGILFTLALKGEGIALLPAFIARELVQAGKLVRLLPDWSSGREPIYAVYPAQRFLSPKLRAFLDCLE